MPEKRRFIPLEIALLTASNTRDENNDVSGNTLEKLLTEAGHHLAERKISRDNIQPGFLAGRRDDRAGL